MCSKSLYISFEKKKKIIRKIPIKLMHNGKWYINENIAYGFYTTYTLIYNNELEQVELIVLFT